MIKPGYVLAASVLASTSPAVQSECVTNGFDLNFVGTCNYTNILSKFEEVFDNPVNRADGCSSTAEEELTILLGGGDIDATIRSICAESVDNFSSLDFDDIPKAGPDFVREYYNGNTEWNEEHETNFPLDDHDNPTNILRSRHVNGRNIYGDAGNVQNVYDGLAQYGVISWPGHLSNFELDKCTTNAAMCCWPSDRQANDNNGNCATPYDAKCEDSDPGDNTNLCYVDFEKGVLSTGFAGTGNSVHNGNDGNGQYEAEGPIHCHGFAWANDESDFTSSYKANNLFYVSMYDHMSQRGYVRNIQGAPMCACTEQMPIVSRSDCTQVDVDEEFEIHYDGGQWSGKLVKVNIDFNACQGFDRRGNNDNNDLWAYMNRLFREGKITIDQLMEIGKVLVGDDPDMCSTSVNDFYSTKGMDRGHNEDEDVWVKVAGVHSLKMEQPFGRVSFDAVFAESPNQIALRRCVYCKYYHREIYYKRLTPIPSEFNHYMHLLNGHYENEDYYVYGTDFELYSSYEDAVAGVNEWQCENYQYNQFFPGNCRPDGGSEGNVGARMMPHSGRSDVAWYVEKSKDRSTGITDYPITTVGSTKIDGSVRSVDDVLHITGSGNGIGTNGNNDVFHFYEEPMTGDLTMTIDLTHFDFVSGWAMAGLMIRESLEPGSKSVNLLMSGHYGLVMQGRGETNANYNSWHTNYANGPMFAATMKLVREGNTFKSYYLKEPAKEIGEATLVSAGEGTRCEPGYSFSKEDCVQAGLSAGGILRNGRLVVGGWGHTPPGCFLYSPDGDYAIHWSTNSNGRNDGNFQPVCKSSTALGSAVGVSEASTVTCRLAIDDYLGSFYYDGIDITKSVTGDHDRWDAVKTVTFTEVSNATMAIYAREAHQTCGNNCDCSGFLMECTSTDPASIWHGLSTSTPGWRSIGGNVAITDKSVLSGDNAANDFDMSLCTSNSNFSLEGASAETRKIWAAERYSNFVVFAINPDSADTGELWVYMSERTLAMPENVYAGIAVTSANSDNLAEATFVNYEIEQNIYPSASPSLSLAPTSVVPSRDVGNYGLAGSSSMTGDGRYILKGTGRDISYRDDGFHAMFENLENGNFSISTYVDSFDFVHGGAKAGVMARFFLCNKSPNAFMGLTGTNGFQMIWRKCMDCNAEHSEVDPNARYTQGWVKLEKLDDEYSGYWKHNEEDEWNLVETVTIESSEPEIYTGLVVSSKKQDQLATAVFSGFNVEEVSHSPTSSPAGDDDDNSRSGNDIGFRFSKVAFPDGDGGIDLPLDERNFGSDNSDLLDVLKDSYCPSVTKLDDSEVYLDVPAMIQSDFVGGYPSHPSDSATNEFWAYLEEVMVMQEARRANDGNDLASSFMPLPHIWEGYSLAMVAEAVHDEYPNLHQSANLARMLGAGGVTIDNDIMPQRSQKQFLRGPVAISDLNTWATAVVGPHSFAAKYHVGRARPEEIVFAIKSNHIDPSFVPGYIKDKIDDIPNFDFAVNFTAYPEGSPGHPSWPAMHSAASQTSFWMSIVLDLTSEQLCQARLVDWGVAYARTIAGVHYGDDNIQGLNLGQEIIAQLLPIYMSNKYGADRDKVIAKAAAMRYNWFDFDPTNPCPF